MLCERGVDLVTRENKVQSQREAKVPECKLSTFSFDSIYCERRYFRAAKFSRIKPHVTFLRGQIFAHLISISI